ncbi:CD276 antigen homolog isoform X2 [Dicentrarchus labrax]|uniref:CD276 antigen homolog isoform X2 n=1 Tax=Dicentrarchus labrax TaxID=13489 RepID=UPI0021F51072|nr:CD276 antigen homolog isoform X2 [Dicentrarchus labrax]
MQNNQRHGSSWDNFGFGNHAHWSAFRGGCAKRKDNRAQVWHNFIGSDMCPTNLLLLLLLLLLSVFHVVLLLPNSSEKIHLNGTRGAPGLWQCTYTSSETFNPKQSSIYWQGKNYPYIVVHVYRHGKENFEHQNQPYINRTKIFTDQLPSGNLSLVIEPLMLEDDQTSLEVVVSGKVGSSDKVCQTTLYVEAPFQKPNIEMNQTEMTATCSTNGGYPEPELKWSGDGGTKLEPQKTTMTREADLTYNISSRVNVTGLQKVTCTVYNPTSNQTLTATKDVSPDEEPKSDTSLAVGLGVGLPLSIIIIILLIVYRHKIYIWCIQNPQNQQNQQNQRNVPDAQPNVAGQNPESIPLRRRNGGAESSTDEDAASGGGASGGGGTEHDKSS